jgi:flavin reductase (DIM6/NTAB) family NADH-FMN oxidoreductase RutF
MPAFVKAGCSRGVCPMQDMKKFRQCLAKFTTGVTVVSCADKSGEVYGITANSFSSVSLDPPLILWNIAKVSRSLQGYLDAGYFAINILAEEQQSISRIFARSEENLFDGIDYVPSENGAPLLLGTLASFECSTHKIIDCGDHYIIIGEVIDFRSNDSEPLLFFDGRYKKIDHD